MFKRILVPTDGSDSSTKALATAMQLALESGGRVRVLHSLDDLAHVSLYEYSGGGDLLRAAREQAARLLQDSMDAAKALGVRSDSRLVEGAGQRLGDVVADEAQSWEADLVVVGTHGRRGASRMLLGSGAEQVMRMAPVPVLVVRSSDANQR